MTRKELVSTREYWIANIQLQLFEMMENYRKQNELKKKDIAEHLNVSKGYITQVLNGDFDHKTSKLVDLALAFGKVPKFEFIDIDKFLTEEKACKSPFAGTVEFNILFGTDKLASITAVEQNSTSFDGVLSNGTKISISKSISAVFSGHTYTSQ